MIWRENSSSTGEGTGPKVKASWEPWDTREQLNWTLVLTKWKTLPPKIGLLPGYNSAKWYAKSFCPNSAALSNSNRRGARNILSVYQAAALSKSEFPVEWGAPLAVELGGYSLWMWFRVLLLMVLGSITAPLMNASKVSSSSCEEILRASNGSPKSVPSLT